MQLDKTRITVRERSYFDILDLALRVVRAGGWPLAAALAAGAAPMMLLDGWLLAGYREPDFDTGFPLHFMIWTMLLVVWEIPLAAAPGTLYLGQVLFRQRPQVKTIVRHLGESLPQLLLYAGVMRLLFVARPYLNEVLLLERNPMRRSGRERISTLGRSRTLHRGESGDLLARTFAAASVGALLVVAIWGSMYMIRSMLVGQWGWDDALSTFYFPLALWIVVSYFTVVRFLAYVDLRIRREGWEVELLMRAERDRLLRQWGGGVSVES